jgi:hypothetical protein
MVSSSFSRNDDSEPNINNDKTNNDITTTSIITKAEVMIPRISLAKLVTMHYPRRLSAIPDEQL